jgi:hypothetical protein
MGRSPLIGQTYRKEEMELIYPGHEVVFLLGDNPRYAEDFSEERIVWIHEEESVKLYICKY